MLLPLALVASAWAGDSPREVPTTGPAVPEMAAFDRIVTELMRKWEVPGGAVGVAKDGRLVLARGYGLADVEARQRVAPDALFRIASLSKPITSAAVLRLVEQGRLALEEPILPRLESFHPAGGKPIDPRLAKVTIEQLLMHAGGFDRGQSFDPMTGGRPLVRALGGLASQRAIIEFMLARPLDFEPGERYAYSNFGYCLLGRAIEQATGQTYDAAVRSLVLRPAGVGRMRLARTRRADRAAGEVCYYSYPGERPVKSIFSEDAEPVSAPYGLCHIEPMDSHGGWLSSTVDLLRFTSALEGARGSPLLKPETRALIETHRVKVSPGHYYGLGWSITPAEGGANWHHNGSLPGVATILVRTPRGLAWTALFNCRPKDGDAFLGELDRALWRAVQEVKTWPEHDLFAEFK